MTRWPSLLSLCIFLGLPLEASGQDGTSGRAASPMSKSTRSGVYSRVQADRGQDVYMGMCKNCHTPESHTGPTFSNKWNGKPLAELYLYLRDQMPKNEPGTLSPEEYADVLAYVLKLNRMPAGPGDLPADAALLRTIRIETSSPAVRKDP